MNIEEGDKGATRKNAVCDFIQAESFIAACNNSAIPSTSILFRSTSSIY